MGFSRQEYWSGLPRPPPGDLPDPGMEPRPHVSCISRGFFITSVTWKVPTPRLVIFKLQKIKDKQRILMELQEKKNLTYRREKIKITSDFSSETTQVRDE